MARKNGASQASQSGKKRCRIDGCRNPARYRGVCVSCYRAAWRAVKAGQTTWARLEAEGVVLPRGGQRTAIHRCLRSVACASQ